MVSNVMGSDFQAFGLQLPKFGKIKMLLGLSATLLDIT
jgi:hypothetical protein